MKCLVWGRFKTWILGCKIGSLPSSYLGMPLRAHFKSKSIWNPVIERIEGRLDSWKASLFSNVLASIPNYFLLLFTVPVSVANHIKRLMMNFLWNDSPEHHHYHLVDWDVVCTSIRKGGLGVRRVRHNNSALLAKWLWRFGRERDRVWRRVVVVQFGEQSVWESNVSHGRHGCGLWKSILKVKESFWRFISFQLELGHDICLWQDPWVGELPRKDRFTNVFSLVDDKWGSTFCLFDFKVNVWSPWIRRNLHDWEIGEFGNLLKDFAGTKPVLNRRDCMVWRSSKNGIFFV